METQEFSTTVLEKVPETSHIFHRQETESPLPDPITLQKINAVLVAPQWIYFIFIFFIFILHSILIDPGMTPSPNFYSMTEIRCLPSSYFQEYCVGGRNEISSSEEFSLVLNATL